MPTPKKPSKEALAVAEEIQGLYEEFAPEAPRLAPQARKREVTRAAREADKAVERIRSGVPGDRVCISIEMRQALLEHIGLPKEAWKKFEVVVQVRPRRKLGSRR